MGTNRPELLKRLLNTTDRIIQEVDSVEYGLTGNINFMTVVNDCDR